MSRILLVQHCPHVGGSAFSAVVTARALLRNGFMVDVAVAEDGPFVTRFQEAGCHVRIVPHHNWLRGGGIIRSMKRWVRESSAVGAFRNLLKERAYDAVCVNTIVSVAAAVAAKREGVPCLWHIRELFDDVGGEMAIPPVIGRSAVRGIVWRFADHVIVNSDAVAKNILGVQEHPRMTVVPNSVDDSLFIDVQDRDEAPRTFGLEAGRPTIGVPGTLRPMKGHPFFLKSVVEVAKRVDDLQVAVTGDGEAGYVAALKQQVEDSGITERVHFLGRIDDMRSFYSACDVICVPSRAEPFGRVAIEAFASGKAVVAAAVGGLTEIISHDETGMLVPYNDAPELSEILTRLISDISLRERLSINARRIAKEKYTEENYGARMTEAVRNILSSQKQQPAVTA